ncbi:MAG: GMC oxidoreductase [Alcanivoracaceae bacterium]|nr:GMC oxidoreductase [Alcanivoracaceae bacterium]
MRVHDLQGLRMFDASIMPTLVGRNTSQRGPWSARKVPR